MQRHRPPPTRFGPRPPAQAKPGAPVATGRLHAPPPTRFVGLPAAQPKLQPARPPAVQMAEASTSDGRGTKHERDEGEGDGRRVRKASRVFRDFVVGTRMDEEATSWLRDHGDDRPLVEYRTDDGEDYAYVPPGSTESPPYKRPNWLPGTYERIAQRQMRGGKLICALCNREIELDANGKEVWFSKSGREHRTRPPIDHVDPDWILRVREIKGEHGNKEGTWTWPSSAPSKKRCSKRTIERSCRLPI
jgi:hypothetical protein